MNGNVAPTPWLYVRATRPAFLSVTLVAVLIGLATAAAGRVSLQPVLAGATLLLAILAHAATNVLNDYYDALNGTDDANTERIHPFTGGSRFIQDGLLSRRATAAYGVALVLLVVMAGLWLTRESAPGLLAIGMAGLLIGWGYSGPPLRLNSRGLGEIAAWAGIALIPIGADFVQRAGFSSAPLVAATSFALMTTNILIVNQFPDRRADEGAGKRHWVVRLGAQRARWLYVAVAALAFAWLTGAVLRGALPALALIALLPGVLSWRASLEVLRYATTPARLAPAIRLTIGAALLHGLLLAMALAIAAARAA